jgi:AAA+ superfamily predicted ATPase
MLENIIRGTKLGKGMTVLKKISYGENWCLCKTFANDTILCVKKELANKWIDIGLVPLDIFCNYAGNNGVFLSASMQGKRLESLVCADSPDSVEDAISFAMSLKKSRMILGGSVDLSDGIFYEQYSCVLPTYEKKDSLSDDVIMGKWLTGGVPISVKKIQEIQSLMSWTSISQIKKIVTSYGIEDEEMEIDSAKGSNQERTISADDFVLYGRKELTDFLNDHIIDIIRHPDDYAVMGIDFPGSVIMYGPPGSGKTYAAEALVDFLGWPSYYINSATIGSKYIHETSKKIADIFHKAMDNAPSIIIIDEMESFLSSRSNVGDNIYHTEEVGEFLRLLQKAKEKRVLILAMTNMVDNIDEAVKRRGRFDHVIKVDMPSVDEIEALLVRLFKNMPIEKDIQTKELAKNLHGQSMADVSFLVKEAGRRTVKARKKFIDQTIIDEVIAEIKKEHESVKSIGFKVDK